MVDVRGEDPVWTALASEGGLDKKLPGSEVKAFENEIVACGGESQIRKDQRVSSERQGVGSIPRVSPDCCSEAAEDLEQICVKA
jgi:hypothetical protein